MSAGSRRPQSLLRRGNRQKRALQYLRSRKKGEQLPHRGQFGASGGTIKVRGPRSAVAAFRQHQAQRRTIRQQVRLNPRPPRLGAYKGLIARLESKAGAAT